MLVPNLPPTGPALRCLVSGTVALLLAAVRPMLSQAADPSALWQIVHEQCVPDMQQQHDPAPCAEVALQPGYAVLKDLVGATQFLLIPTARISGIEDPAVLAPTAPNYWQAAWQARSLVDQRLGHPLRRDALALAINSAFARTQNQLHIHIDCVRVDVHDALLAHNAEIGAVWAPFSQPLAGTRYRAMRLIGEDIAPADPFRLLAASISANQMRYHTLVAIGADFDGIPGFVLLDGQTDPTTSDRGSGEALEDHNCAIGKQ